VDGLILILIIMFAPRGFMGFINYLKLRWFSASTSKAKLEKAS
jgi:hypothetical protein